MVGPTSSSTASKTFVADGHVCHCSAHIIHMLVSIYTPTSVVCVLCVCKHLNCEFARFCRFFFSSSFLRLVEPIFLSARFGFISSPFGHTHTHTLFTVHGAICPLSDVGVAESGGRDPVRGLKMNPFSKRAVNLRALFLSSAKQLFSSRWRCRCRRRLFVDTCFL